MLNLQIISPEALIFEGFCTEVNLPGVDGRLGVLFGHMSLITMLESGIVEVTTQEQKTLQFQISGGFANIDGKSCVILTDKCWDKPSL